MEQRSTYDYLIAHGVKPSVQRMAVMDYLRQHPTHPTADRIYADLLSAMPTLSKTTVYNTLRVLVESGAVGMLTIDEKNACFDAETSPHAHFLCTTCGCVHDLPLCVGGWSGVCHLPDGFSPKNFHLYVRGLCPQCQGQAGTKAEKAV